MSTKEKTYEKAAATQEKAVRFLREVVGDQEKADEIESLSVSEYGARKGFVLTNPSPHTTTLRSTNDMATEEVELTKLRKDELIEEVKRTEEEWGGLCDDIWAEVIADDDGTISAQEALDNIAELLNEFDPGRYPFDEDEEGQPEEGFEDEAA